jgi:glycosyltransferase involved in cell wall biosynthesis
MRILFISHYFPPEGNAPASRAYEMCRRWTRAGHDVTVITGVPNVPAGIPYPGYRNRLHQRETIDGINVIRVWTYLAPNKGTVRRILNYVSFMKSASMAGLCGDRPDIVVATSPQFFCGWAGVIVSRLRRLPFVLEIRDIWPESIVSVGAMKKGLTIRFLGWMERKMYACARHIVTVGDGYKEQLIAKGVAADKVTVITNGVDRDMFRPREPDMELKQKFGLGDAFVCSYIGTIGMACGLDVVLRAARILKNSGRNDIRFLLVGDGAVREDLENRARAEELNHVVFTGLQPKHRIPALLSITDASLIHLAKKELFESVFPSKLLESFATAKPIILGVRGYAAHLLQDANAGICIEPENENDLVAAVERLAADRNLAARFGLSGYSYVTGHFNLDELAAKYVTLLETTLKT